MLMLLASLSLPATAARLALAAPSPGLLATQESLLGLQPGERVKPGKLVSALKREAWVRAVSQDGDTITVELVRGPIGEVRLELSAESEGGRHAAVALDAQVRGSPTWQELFGDLPPGQPFGFDAQGRALWEVSPGVVVATTRDDAGVLRPAAIDAGLLDVAVLAGTLRADFTSALAIGDLDRARQVVEQMAPFGLRQVMALSDRWRDQRAQLCGVPLVVLANRAADSRGIERRRAARSAVEHALGSCLVEDGTELLSIAQPPLSRLVADVGTLPGIEGQSAWASLGRGRLPSIDALEDLHQALFLHRGPGARALADGTWAAADWPARVQLLSDVETSLRRATSQERPALEQARDRARDELRSQLLAEESRARAEGRLATAEVAKTVLAALSGAPPAPQRPLTASDQVATWLRRALVAPEGRDDAAALLRAALANNRLDTIGLALPADAALTGDPALSWGSLETGLLRAAVRGPTVSRETLVHSWQAPTEVPNPQHQAAVAERTRIAQALAELRAPERPLVPAQPVLAGPDQVALGQDLDGYRSERRAWLDGRLRELDRVRPTTARRVPAEVNFQAEVQRWQGTVHRTFRLTLPSGLYSQEPLVDVSEWRYVRHGANPAVGLPDRDQLTELGAVEDRAAAELDASAADDLAALLAQGIAGQAWALASSLPVDPIDQAREAAALQWLLTGREAPDIQGIGFIDGLASTRPEAIPGSALLVRTSPDGERALVLRSPFTFEIYEVESGRRLLGPYEVAGRVNVVDGDSVSVVFNTSGSAVRVADTAVDLSSGRILGHDAREAQDWLKRYEQGELVELVERGGTPHVQVSRKLSRRPPFTAPLPPLEGGPWTLGRGIAAPDLDEVAIELLDADGDSVVLVLDLPNGNVLAKWTEGSPRLGRTPEGIAVSDARGVQLATWAARGVDLRTRHRRPPLPGDPDRGGTLLWHPGGIVEVFDGSSAAAAVFYADDGGWVAPFTLPAGGQPSLQDGGRLLVTQGRGGIHLTPVPTTSEAVR